MKKHYCLSILKSKEIIAFLFLSLFVVKANAQIQLEKFRGYTPDIVNCLIVASDRELPIHDGMCRKLIPDITLDNEGVCSRYYWEDVPMDEQWYKNLAFLKILLPNTSYQNEKIAVFDVASNKYWDFIGNNNNYIHLSDDAPDPNINSFYFDTYSKQPYLGYGHKVRSKVYRYYLSPVSENGQLFMSFLDEDDSNRKVVYYYTVKNVDFVNDKLPYSGNNTEPCYLLLQRDYKLGNKYNTVIFPVDVPVKEFHHLYNNGLNRLRVYRLDRIEDNSLHFVSDFTGVLKADTPYIIKSEKGDQSSENEVVSEYYMTDSEVSNYPIDCIQEVMHNNDGVQVFAEYRQSVTLYNENLSPDYDVFVVSNNKLINCRNIGQATVKRFRWYIRRPVSSNPIPMTMTFDGTTDIDTSVIDNTNNDDTVYDLNGQNLGKLSSIHNLSKGYYIVNGKVRLIAE